MQIPSATCAIVIPIIVTALPVTGSAMRHSEPHYGNYFGWHNKQINAYGDLITFLGSYS